MKVSSLALSVLLHVACVATAILVSAPRQVDSEPNEREEITFVEILDESSVSAPEKPPLPDKPQPPVETLPPPPEPPTPTEPTPPVMVPESSPPVEPPKPRDSSKPPVADTPSRPVPPADSSCSHFAKCEPIESSQVVSLPAAVNRIAPKYPRSARRKGHEGRVLVEAEIGVAGEVLRVDVLDSSGHPELDSSAVDAVRSAEFVSAKDGDRPVVGVIRLPIEFRLK